MYSASGRFKTSDVQHYVKPDLGQGNGGGNMNGSTLDDRLIGH
jgi:hypothetical protein